MPALTAALDGLWMADAEGARKVERAEALRVLSQTKVILLNAPVLGAKLGHGDIAGLDLLELFAFTHPAVFAVPTIIGMADALGMARPDGGAEEAGALRRMAATLLSIMARDDWTARSGA
ncbi:MAG: ATP-dependent DNA helicase, partial [Pacificimonas sp.]